MNNTAKDTVEAARQHAAELSDNGLKAAIKSASAKVQAAPVSENFARVDVLNVYIAELSDRKAGR